MIDILTIINEMQFLRNNAVNIYNKGEASVYLEMESYCTVIHKLTIIFIIICNFN